MKKKKIDWSTSREGVEYLRQYIDQILDVIAEVSENEGIRKAFVSDESSVGDFFPKRVEVRPGVFFGVEDDDEYREKGKEVADQLGVEIDGFTVEGPKSANLFEIAKRMVHG